MATDSKPSRTGSSTHAKGNGPDETSGDEIFDDIVIITEGKKRIHTHSSLLCHNSKVFSDALRPRYQRPIDGCHGQGVGKTLGDEESLSSRSSHLSLSELPFEIDMSNRNYKDVKLVLSFLRPKGSREDLKGDKVWRVLPIAAEYKMSGLKKSCGLALTEAFLSMRKENESKTIPTSEGLRYLAAAEKYGFDKLKKMCIKELANKIDTVARKEIIDDKHISWKLKVHVLDKMFDEQTNETETRLKQIQHTMELRCSEVERRRKEYVQGMEKWKAELRDEVNEMKKEAADIHKQLLEKMERDELVEEIEKKISDMEKSLISDIKSTVEYNKSTLESLIKEKKEYNVELRELNDSVLQNIEKADKATKLPIQHVLKTVKDRANESLTEIQETRRLVEFRMDTCIKRISECAKQASGSLWKHLLKCDFIGEIEALSSSLMLTEEVDRLNAEIAFKIQSITAVEIQNEQAKLEQQRTKAELYKYQKKWTAVNTWLKWACPTDDLDESKCLCHRHVVTPRV